jgi:hypothetical protein
MEKKKLAKALVLTAALAGGIGIAQSFVNEVQASGPTCRIMRVDCAWWFTGDRDVCTKIGQSVQCTNCGSASICY